MIATILQVKQTEFYAGTMMAVLNREQVVAVPLGCNYVLKNLTW